MKKILLAALFIIGLVTLNHAQTLNYELINSSMAKWDFQMMNAGSSGITSEMGILPGKNRSGTVSGFKLPMQIKVENSDACGTSEFIPRPIPFTGKQIDCDHHAEIKYELKEMVPFMVYRFELHFG